MQIARRGPAAADPHDHGARAIEDDLGAKPAQGIGAPPCIVAQKEAVECGPAFGPGGQNQGSVRNAFAAGHGDDGIGDPVLGDHVDERLAGVHVGGCDDEGPAQTDGGEQFEERTVETDRGNREDPGAGQVPGPFTMLLVQPGQA